MKILWNLLYFLLVEFYGFIVCDFKLRLKVRIGGYKIGDINYFD